MSDDHVIHLENGKMAPDTPRSTVNAIVQQAVSNPAPGGIILHFHGGLVSYNYGKTIANKLTPKYISAGAYPIFFVWESGLLETLSNNMKDIAKEAVFKTIWSRVAGIVESKIGQSPGDRSMEILPKLDVESVEKEISLALDQNDLVTLAEYDPQIPDDLEELSGNEQVLMQNELERDAKLIQEFGLVSDNLRDHGDIEQDIQNRSPCVQGATNTLMDPHALERFVEGNDGGKRGFISTYKIVKALIKIAARVIKRYIQKSHHGFHATIIEEILRELYLSNVGEYIWGLMKEDTRDAFKDDASVYGGTALVTALQNNIDVAKPPKITLVGHSTGAIYIASFLDKASTMFPASVKYDVIFLAPASKCELTASMLQAHANLISNFRMFTMTDEYEKKDKLVKYLYPHSLLYFISGVLEGDCDVPIVGMNRFYDSANFPSSDFPDVAIVRDFVLGQQNRVVWSVDKQGPDGQRSSSQKHGEFDDNDLTVESMQHIISFGY